MPKKSLTELIRARWILTAKSEGIARDLDTLKGELRNLDREITTRLDKLAGALEVDTPEELEEPDEQVVAELYNPRVVLSSPSLFSPSNRVKLVRRPNGAPGTRTSKYDDDIAAVLAKAKRPMKTKEIYDELRRQGTQISGKVPINNLSAHLSHSEKFVSTERGWALKQSELGAH